MFAALDSIERKFDSINEKMADQAIASDPSAYEKLAREIKELRPVVTFYRDYRKQKEKLDEALAVINEGVDKDLMELAAEEKAELAPIIEKMERDLRLMLLPKDENDEKNVILEIRAGTGGDEAGLFAAELFRMYCRYAERQKWKVEILSINETGIGGLKEVIASINGRGVYSRLKFESGVHRVQRVPATEAQGRIHTSAVTVAILPEAGEVDVDIDPNDLRIDVFRAGGHGGQSVNTTDSAVRITHIPTGLVVSMQDEKSQHKNKAKAMKVLAARLKDQKEREEAAKRSAERKSQVGTGDRSERIRTYNFPQGRVSDHRINLTLYKLEIFMTGEIDEMLDALTFASQEAALRAQADKETAGV
ncbi:MAG: peptide chain release factor 1 [Nitrospinae bacterium]|nr:peptide chain release factor 1 [Nitrospinota bacterium]